MAYVSYQESLGIQLEQGDHAVIADPAYLGSKVMQVSWVQRMFRSPYQGHAPKGLIGYLWAIHL